MRNYLISRFSSQPALLQVGSEQQFTALVAEASDALDDVMQCASIDLTTHALDSEEGFWPEPDSVMSRYRPYNVRNGVLSIPIKGILINDFSLSLGNYLTGYQYIQKAFERGMADPEVRGIALVIDSPGGEVAGNFDLADQMYRDKRKRVRAFAAESAYSAAYSLASTADDIVVSRTGGVGSIGVVTAHVDFSRALDREGVKVTFVHFGKHKVEGNPYEPLSDDAKARMQARIDRLGEMFVSIVARNRNLSEQAVRSTEALTYMAEDSVSSGLADSVGSLGDGLAAFAAELSDQEVSMSGQNTQAVDQATAIESAREEGYGSGYAEGVKNGATAERERISAILNCEEGKARPKAALSVAMRTEMSADAAKAFLADLAVEKAEDAPKGASSQALFEAAMSASGNPEVGVTGEGETEEMSESDRALTDARSFGIPGLRKRG